MTAKHFAVIGAQLLTATAIGTAPLIWAIAAHPSLSTF
ncbi:hypothetical protein EV13_0119 [Prochlorococcus sp. MIT 0702]|nr:hypothetical protein EV12_0368 [Prochlorococcus sp. MIT 0701]KGG30614.1 hypothetical protein EV13_0119 [Prochlorococcus sp. MIT 0702]KGG36664.1 hypothetical protein EV14_0220 [Prochlorococcus sp. MIT 0703]